MKLLLSQMKLLLSRWREPWDTGTDIHEPEQNTKMPPGRGLRGARVWPGKVTDCVSQKVGFEMAQRDGQDSHQRGGDSG